MINTKLNIGDTIYNICCTAFTGQNECEVCNGTGKIKIPNWNDEYCPKCYGKGYIETYGEKEWRLDQDFCGLKVGKIEAEQGLIRKNGKNTYVKARYSPVGFSNFINEEDIFSSEKEALDECKFRNKQCD